MRDVAVRTPDGYAAANTVDAVQLSILAITAILAILAIHLIPESQKKQRAEP